MHSYWQSLANTQPSFWGMYCCVTVVMALAAAFSISARKAPVSEFTRNGAIWEMIRSGAWGYTLCYPWAGPMAHFESWAWLVRVYDYPFDFMVAAASASVVLQSMLAALLVVYWESSRTPAAVVVAGSSSHAAAAAPPPAREDERASTK